MSFPRYPKYKDSGVDWFGDMPEHWEVIRFQRCVYVAEGQVDPEDPAYAEMSLIAPNHIESGTGRLLNLESADDQGAESGKYMCKAGDVVYSKIRPALRKVCIAPEDCLCSADMYPLRSHSGLTNPFLFWLMLSEHFSALAVVVSQRVAMPKINRESLKPVLFAVPSFSEQTTIASFLDRETAKIDGLVAEQRRLIELLKEKRQAIISYAVTKGLNPHAALQPTGVEWLGDVPEHWSVAALRYFATFSTGSTPDRATAEYWNGGIPWVKTGEINYLTIMTTEETISSEGIASCSVKIAPAGALLVAMYGEGVTRGRVALLGIPSTYNQACVAIQTDERLTSEFLHAFFVFAYSFIRDIGNETTQMNLNAEFIRRIRVVIPPLGEQKAIVARVRTETAKLDNLTAEAQCAIDLLQERRTALISAAVTGKIDVRGLVETEAA